MRLLAILSFITLYNSAKCFDYILELSDEDFDDQISKQEVTMVMFYAPWCGHCKNLKPEYERAAQILSKNDPAVILSRIDCTERGIDVCGKEKIKGYPTLKVYKSGRFLKDYTGHRDSNGIVKHMLAQMAPPSKELPDFESLTRFMQPSEVVVVGFFQGENELKAVFFNLGDELREKIKFGHTTNETMLEKFGVDNDIILFRPRHLHNKFEVDFVKFSDFATTQGLNDFIFKNYHGLVGHRTPENLEDFKTPYVIAYYNVDYAKNPKGTNYYRNRILKAAKDFKDQITFAVSSKDDFEQEINDFGVDVEGDLILVIAKDANNKKYIMSDDFSYESIHGFAENFLAKKLTPFLKSEPIPEDNDVKPVKTAVGKNFKEVVLDNGKDTMVKFYAPWCGHCKKLVPVFEDLARRFEDEDVAFVEVDATENDVPDVFEIRGYPTIYWLPKYGKDQPVRYEGGRELKDFLRFVAREATDELKGFDRDGKKKTVNEEL